jgi:propanol-preferring alcohol dehydrogenase
MPLRPILKKDLVIRSNETGTKADMKAALEICAAGEVTPEVQMLGLKNINDVLDKIKSGKVMGKIVLDLKAGL